MRAVSSQAIHMLLARFLLAGSMALMLGWAVLVGVVFEDPSLLRADDRGDGEVSIELAAAIEELELLRDAVAELRAVPARAPAALAAETPSQPSPPVAAGAPPDEAAADEVAPASTSESAPSPSEYPEFEPQRTHRVAIGESLSSIADRYDVTVEQLAAFNSLRDPSVIELGSLLLIP